jgi:glycosyltransferase involved in cell wall biosynthesis
MTKTLENKNNKKKIFAIFIAYNASKSLESFYKEFPKHLFDQILLVDDASSDGTYDLAVMLGIRSYKNQTNLGYGGNIKRAVKLALDQGADVIVDLHPDGEYKPSAILPSLKLVTQDDAEFVLGNRFTSLKKIVGSGMYLWKIIPIIILNIIPKFILKINITDFHQGFRVYTRNLLEKLNYQENSNDYLFSFELIAQAAYHNIRIVEVPVENNYTGTKRGASLRHSIKYSLGVFKILFSYILVKKGFNFKIYQKPLPPLED